MRKRRWVIVATAVLLAGGAGLAWWALRPKAKPMGPPPPMAANVQAVPSFARPESVENGSVGTPYTFVITLGSESMGRCRGELASERGQTGQVEYLRGGELLETRPSRVDFPPGSKTGELRLKAVAAGTVEFTVKTNGVGCAKGKLVAK